METTKPIGVILCGGQSSRMGVDKSLINYYDVSQREYLKKLLTPLCSPVLYSTGSQIELDEKSFPDLPEYEGHGPISGLLSIHEHFPNSAILLIGCDYPLIQKKDLEALITEIQHEDAAVCYTSGASLRPEPLITLYSSEFCEIIKAAFEQGESSLKRLLDKANTRKLTIEDPLRLTSADRPEDVTRVRQIIQSGYPTFEA